MDVELPEELRLLQRTVRQFVDREMIPIEQRSMDGHKLRPEIRADLEAKAKALGLPISKMWGERRGAGVAQR